MTRRRKSALNDSRKCSVVFVDSSRLFFSLCHSRAKRRIPESFSLTLSLCHSEPLRRRIPGAFFVGSGSSRTGILRSADSALNDTKKDFARHGESGSAVNDTRKCALKRRDAG